MIFWLMFLGHLIGDYLLQSNYMAMNKKKKVLPCVAHCAQYTVVVVLLTAPFMHFTSLSLYFLYTAMIFTSHIIIDSNNFVSKYLEFIGSRSLSEITNKTDKTPEEKGLTFYAFFVNTLADNTIHLGLMTWIIYKMVGWNLC